MTADGKEVLYFERSARRDEYEIPDEPLDLLGELEQLRAQNVMLIAQSGRDEIVIQEQAETIRDLEVEIAAWKTWAASTKEIHAAQGEALEAAKRDVACWKEVAKSRRKKAIINRMAVYDLQAEKNVEQLRAERAEHELTAGVVNRPAPPTLLHRER